MDVGNLISVLDTLSGYSAHVSGLCDFPFFFLTNGLIVRQVTEFICLRDGPCYILTTSLEASCHRYFVGQSLSPRPVNILHEVLSEPQMFCFWLRIWKS